MPRGGRRVPGDLNLYNPDAGGFLLSGFEI